MKAVILAASAAERLHPFTETRAKPMIQVAGQPIMERMAVALGNAGEPHLEGPLMRLAEEPDPVVREHARWALARLRGDGRKKRDDDPPLRGKP